MEKVFIGVLGAIALVGFIVLVALDINDRTADTILTGVISAAVAALAGTALPGGKTAAANLAGFITEHLIEVKRKGEAAEAEAEAEAAQAAPEPVAVPVAPVIPPPPTVGGATMAQLLAEVAKRTGETQ